MKSIKDIEELRNIQLDILRYIHKICDENNLTYFLAGGTLLGAVRHKGYIPWDDDIDIAMPRKDYYKLLKIIGSNSNNSFYGIKSFEVTEGYYYPFAKLVDTRTKVDETEVKDIEGLGINIDIFILDGLKNTFNGSYRCFKVIRLLRHMAFMSSKKIGIRTSRGTNIKTKMKIAIGFPYLIVCKFIGSKNINKLLSKFASRNDFDTSKYIASATGGRYGKREILLQEYFSSTCNLEFEGEVFKAPIGYHEYLASLYGDYMKLPPKEKQQSHHSFKAWWI